MATEEITFLKEALVAIDAAQAEIDRLKAELVEAQKPDDELRVLVRTVKEKLKLLRDSFKKI